MVIGIEWTAATRAAMQEIDLAIQQRINSCLA